MIAIAAKPSLSFEEYLKYNDGTDNRYEFFDGELILMNPPTGRHALIIRNLCNLLENEFLRLGLLWVALKCLECGLRGGDRVYQICV